MEKLGAPAKCALLIAAVWLISRIPFLLNAEFWAEWDIFQARKLLEYGFLERKGAVTAELRLALCPVRDSPLSASF
jgi:hypothetical protein